MFLLFGEVVGLVRWFSSATLKMLLARILINVNNTAISETPQKIDLDIVTAQ